MASTQQLLSTSSIAGEIRRLQRADGPAAVLAIGTANPPNCLTQDEYPDYYFRVTKSQHLTDLKRQFTTFCQRSGSKRRFFHHTEETIDAHPEFLDVGKPSLDSRLDIAAVVAPELAASAATRAISKWGRPATDITHLIVSTNSGAHAPGVDLRLASLLGLRASVIRTMMHLNGCSGGAAALRLAMDQAENNRGARVLVVCVELTVVSFRGPADEAAAYPHNLISQASFGDGAGAVIVGAAAADSSDDTTCTHHHAERPLFEMVSVSQTVVPETDDVLTMKLTEGGIDGHIFTKELIPLAANIIQQCLSDAFGPLGVLPLGAAETDDGGVDGDDVDNNGGGDTWNGLFWAVHPGISAILDRIDVALRLEPGKLAASRAVLRDYGNMLGATVIFVLDEQRRRMEEEEGEWAEWGVMMGFGPGFTIETMVLRATSNLKKNQ